MIDSHSHIYTERYRDDRDAVIARAAVDALVVAMVRDSDPEIGDRAPVFVDERHCGRWSLVFGR